MVEHPPMRIATEDRKALPRKVAITKKTIDTLKCPPGRRDIHVYDSKVHGLAFRLTSNGGGKLRWKHHRGFGCHRWR